MFNTSLAILYQCHRYYVNAIQISVHFFSDSIKAENPQSHEEIVEVLMIELRKLCELKQQDHSHISDPNKPHFRQEV